MDVESAFSVLTSHCEQSSPPMRNRSLAVLLALAFTVDVAFCEDTQQQTAVCSGAAGYGTGCNQHASQEEAAAEEEARRERIQAERERDRRIFFNRFAAFVFGCLGFLTLSCCAFAVQMMRVRRSLILEAKAQHVTEFAIELPSGELAIVIEDTGGVRPRALAEAIGPDTARTSAVQDGDDVDAGQPLASAPEQMAEWGDQDGSGAGGSSSASCARSASPPPARAPGPNTGADEAK